jgi:hypothetical protein
LGKAPTLEVEGKIRRMGDLGGFIFNELLWEDDWMTFPIGADIEDHRKARPVADFVTGDQKRSGPKGWTREIIAEHVQEFFSNRQSFKEDDVKKLVGKILHRVFFNVKITDIEATDFEIYKSASLTAAIIPRWMAADSITGIPAAKKQRNLMLDKFMDWIKKDTRGVYPADIQGRDLRFLADFALTVMTSAGGTSVPFVIRHALAVIYGDRSPLPESERRISEDTLRPFIYETIRRYPVVLGFPWWDLDIKERTVPNVGMALMDDRAWGDADNFRIRSMEEYETKAGFSDKIGVAWAEQARGSERLTADSRGCPSRELSLTIVEEFLRGMMPMQEQWKITEKPEAGLVMPEGAAAMIADFTLSRGNQSVRTVHEPAKKAPSNDKERGTQLSKSFDHQFADSKPEPSKFVCPEPCLQCCQSGWIPMMARLKQDKGEFKCVIHNDPTAVTTFKVIGRECSKPRSRRSDKNWAKSTCKFSTAEKAAKWYKQVGKCQPL